MQLEHLASGHSDGGAVSVTLEVPPSPSAPAAPAAPTSPEHAGPLPFTGLEIDWLVMAAIALIVTGIVLLTILRTRLESSHA